MQSQAIRACRVSAVVLFLSLVSSGIGYPQSPAPLKDIASFFQQVIGDWIGTVEQYTNGVSAETKYFHAVATQTGPNTYQSVFEYYRLDENTHAPVRVGVTNMTTNIAPDGTATNTIIGQGDVLINFKSTKPENHQLSEVLRITPTGSLAGKGSGRISVSGLFLGAGKNGKVSKYSSTWEVNDDKLTITEQLRATFSVLFFAKHYDVRDNLQGTRGSDIIGLMKSAAATTATPLTPSPQPKGPG